MEGNPVENKNIILERYGLKKGTKVTLIKRYSGDGSAVPEGKTSTGTLLHDIKIGTAIELDNGARTTAVSIASEQDGRLYVKTNTSVYELILTSEVMNTTITKEDLDSAIKNFSQKGYGEWDLTTGKVPLDDDPYHQLLLRSGFREHDQVEFYADGKARYGVVVDSAGGYKINDLKGNPWGLVAIFTENGAYLKKI